MTRRLALGILLVPVALASALVAGCVEAPGRAAPHHAPDHHAPDHHAPDHHAPPRHASSHHAPTHHAPAHRAAHDEADREAADPRLAEVARAHGGAGPWAVAGYRMGEHALRVLGVERGSFDLEVVHHTPDRVQYACIADGAAAATGASVGKLNLSLAPATAEETRTVYRRRSTGQVITLRLTPGFVARFADVPRPRLAEAGREVIALTDAAIFETVP